MGTPVGRAIALLSGMYLLATAGGTESLWLVDVRPLPAAWLFLPGGLLVFHAARPARARPAVAAAVLALVAVLAGNAVAFARAPVDAAVPVPFTLVVAAALLLVLRAPRWPGRIAVPAVVLAAVALPLALAFFFGKTSYARDADVIVVFGARTYADGRPSHSLRDRVVTACRLYREGRAPRLLLSGGPGDGAVHETEAMRRLALDLGVPAAAIEIDARGVNTAATVAHTGPGRILAVSHFWHLPRVKLAYRAAGRTVYTVPAEEPYVIRQTPKLMLREVLAFWWYWLRAAA